MIKKEEEKLNGYTAMKAKRELGIFNHYTGWFIRTRRWINDSKTRNIKVALKPTCQGGDNGVKLGNGENGDNGVKYRKWWEWR